MIHKIMVYLGTSLAVQWFKTLCFQCRGHGFNPWLGSLRYHMSHGLAKKKKKVYLIKEITDLMKSTILHIRIL